MKFFEATIETVIIRYYLMMAAVIIPFLVGIPLLAIVALPIFLSALMGVKFERKVNKSSDIANAPIEVSHGIIKAKHKLVY